jgi:hypothetical protein
VTGCARELCTRRDGTLRVYLDGNTRVPDRVSEKTIDGSQRKAPAPRRGPTFTSIQLPLRRRRHELRDLCGLPRLAVEGQHLAFGRNHHAIAVADLARQKRADLTRSKSCGSRACELTRFSRDCRRATALAEAAADARRRSVVDGPLHGLMAKKNTGSPLRSR